MKKILSFIIILIIATACDDVLKEEPHAVAVETFYKTADEIEAGVYAAYGEILNGIFYQYLIANCEVDYAVGRVSFANYSDLQGNLINDSRIPEVWTYYYRVIRNANLIIGKGSEVSGVSQDEINQLVGEARFVRAFVYFNLFRNFGPVPLRTEENMSELSVPRSNKDVIFDLILNDLDFAEANLPESQSMAGRADKYAAKALLADVSMFLDDWSVARNKALEVINSGNYSLINVTKSDDFYKIFGADIVRTSEEIFYIKSNIDRTTQLARYRHSPSAPYLNYGGVFAKYADSITNRAISEWDTKDLRKNFNLYSANIGFGLNTMLFKKYVDYNPTGQNGKNDFPVYRYTDMFLIYAEADCRVNNGPTTDGMEKLNMIHRRGYGYDPNSVSPVDFKKSDYNAESFIDLVLKEALYEQMDEAKRKFNLIRTGKMKEEVKYARGIDVLDRALLWPIPSSEYLYNDAIDPDKDQNPGY